MFNGSVYKVRIERYMKDECDQIAHAIKTSSILI